MDRRTGDRVTIPGDYQYHALYSGSAPQRFWHRFKLTTAIQNLALGSKKNVPDANDRSPMHILDAGCGSGMLSALITAQDPSIRLTGLDANPAAIAFCREKWQHLGNVRFVQGQIDELQQFPDGAFDRISFLEVIEHLTVPQAERVLREFHRSLRTGGLLVISTPNRNSPWPFLEFILDTFRLAPRLSGDQHENLYSGSELLDMCRKNGFTAIRRQRINFLAPWLALLSPKLAQKTHAWEAKQHWLPGPLLVYTFRKDSE
jgi:2-polyprenyl-3-methyl-5-hydroxy-6-metoxy-1,4-benzoquinol methylase